jgi:3-hydroxyacyl-[acyl-carrier-protein] dehydratase
VDKAKVRSFVEPGTPLVLLGSLVHEGSGFAVTTGEVKRDGERVVSAELRFRTLAFPDPSLRDTVRRYAESVGLDAAG